METIVIATDNLDVLQLLGPEAEALGYDVVWKENGLELMEEVGQRCPAAVFIDISLPVIGAYACCRELRRDPTLPPELPIFLLSDDDTNHFVLAKFGFSGAFPKKHGFFSLREFLAQNVWK